VISLFKSDSAVSESVGYVMVASILSASLIIIYMVGYPVYNDYINQGHIENMNEGFYILSDTANKVAKFDATFQSCELKLYGGNLKTRNDGNIKISYYSNEDGTGYIGNVSRSIDILEYDMGTRQIAYILGSVGKNTLDGSIILKSPEMYLTDTDPANLIIPITSINLKTVNSFSGEGLTRITFISPYYAKRSQSISYPKPIILYDQIKLVQIELESDYSQGLGNYFVRELGFSLESSVGNNVTLNRSFADKITLSIIPSQIEVEVD
jgi:hypothetical protein